MPKIIFPAFLQRPAARQWQHPQGPERAEHRMDVPAVTAFEEKGIFEFQAPGRVDQEKYLATCRNVFGNISDSLRIGGPATSIIL
jgi:hypothetical protein